MREWSYYVPRNDTSEEQPWSSNRAKSVIRDRITALGHRQEPVKAAILMPSAEALDVLSARKNGLIQRNITNCLFIENDDQNLFKLRRTVSRNFPSIYIEYYTEDVTQGVKPATPWTQPPQPSQSKFADEAVTDWLKRIRLPAIDYCYLDYCGVMSWKKFELNQSLSKYIADAAILSVTLTYSRSTTTTDFMSLMSARVHESDVDRLWAEIEALPAGSFENFLKTKDVSRLALASAAAWLNSWPNRPILEQFYCYVGGNSSTGYPMISFRTRFQR